MKHTQREAVYSATINVMSEKGIDFEDGGSLGSVMTDDIRKSVHAIVFAGFMDGTVEFEPTPSNQEKLKSPAKLNSYVSGLISNWYRKDVRFNGNTKYTPKNPGSRAGQGDQKLKTLRALAVKFSADPQKLAFVNGCITTRLGEIAAERTKSVSLTAEQIATLPADVRETLGL